jgi:hypothetical protein
MKNALFFPKSDSGINSVPESGLQLKQKKSYMIKFKF